MQDIEIEIQVRVEDSAPLTGFLEKNGSFKSEKNQIDQYFSPAHRDFTAQRPVAEWLRLRDAEGKYSLNYKNWHVDQDGKSQYCDEYETAIESLDAAAKILRAMDFRLLTSVDKVRKTWNYKDYEVAVDKVKDLGDFVEVEYKGAAGDADPKLITEQMVAFLKEVGCGGIERNYVGYPFLLLFPDEAKWERQ